MIVSTQDLPSGGVRIHIAHDESDSLAVVEVTHRYSQLALRGGLRGNFDADKRRMRWVSTSMEAPLVSAQERLERCLSYIRRRGIRHEHAGSLVARLAGAAREEQDAG